MRNLPRRDFMKLLGLSASGGMLLKNHDTPEIKEIEPTKPNIVIIIADDLGCTGMDWAI